MQFLTEYNFKPLFATQLPLLKSIKGRETHIKRGREIQKRDISKN